LTKLKKNTKKVQKMQWKTSLAQPSLHLIESRIRIQF